MEREVKLEAGVGFRVPDLDGVAPGVTSHPQPEQHLQAVYVDTPDLRLVRGGLTLRHRSERSSSGNPGEWTLKLPEESLAPGLSRREINWPGRWGSVPAEIAGLVRAYRRTATLGPVARLITHRRRSVLVGRGGEPLLEIDDDVVSVMEGRRLAARFREVEVEVVGAAADSLLEAVVARLREAGAVPSDGRSKVVRAIGSRATEPPDVVAVSGGRDTSIGEVVRAAVAHGYLRLVAHDLGVRLDEDPEDVHQARVATRRLRSDLRTFRAYLPDDWSAETRAELGWLAEALGRARDADVLFERLHGQADSLDRRDGAGVAGLLGRLVAERDFARRQVLSVLDSDRYGELLDRLVAAARELPPVKTPSAVEAPLGPGADVVGMPEAAPPEAAPPEVAPVAATAPGPVAPDRDALARRQAPGVVAGPWRHLARAVSGLGPEPSDDALHEVRIRAKRLRYACEAVASSVGKPASELARAAAELQGVLGDFHDAIVAEDWLRQASADGPPALALAAGQLVAREREDAGRGRDAWPASWKRVSRKKLRAWLG